MRGGEQEGDSAPPSSNVFEGSFGSFHKTISKLYLFVGNMQKETVRSKKKNNNYNNDTHQKDTASHSLLMSETSHLKKIPNVVSGPRGLKR